jgi:uncharacterized protein YndB with AHSA1/START domain
MNADPKELFITHLFDAPRNAVFQAWTDPEQLKHWYAPDGCTIEFKTIDPTQGGKFHSCIHDPVHGECWVKGTYLKVLPDQELVFTMVMSDEAGNSLSSVKAGKTGRRSKSQRSSLNPLAGKPKFRSIRPFQRKKRKRRVHIKVGSRCLIG